MSTAGSARDRLVVGVAGDITAEELAPLLDATFGDLPAGRPLPELAPVTPRVGHTEVQRLAIPQSVVAFGHAGLDRHDPDYYAAYAANYLLGGGGFSSRLLEEIREKRGLAYSAYSYLYELDAAPLWLGGVATNNQQVAQSIALVRRELARMARGELDAADLANARTYITGSFPLRLTSNDQMAKTLASMLRRDLGRDFLAAPQRAGRGGDPGRPAPRLGPAVLGRAAGQRGGRPGRPLTSTVRPVSGWPPAHGPRRGVRDAAAPARDPARSG